MNLPSAEIQQNHKCKILEWACQDSRQIAQIKNIENMKREDYIRLVIAGEDEGIRQQHRQYIGEVIGKIDKIRKIENLKRLIMQMTGRTASEINISKLAKSVGLERPTLENYLEILQQHSLITKLDAWIAETEKRQIKSPKYHFLDTGIVASMHGWNVDMLNNEEEPRLLTPMLESFVVCELMKNYKMHDFYHWRNSAGQKIDVIIDDGKNLICINVKPSLVLTETDFENTNYFQKQKLEKNRKCVSIVFYMGNQPIPYTNNSFGLPISALWAEVEITQHWRYLSLV